MDISKYKIVQTILIQRYLNTFFSNNPFFKSSVISIGFHLINIHTDIFVMKYPHKFKDKPKIFNSNDIVLSYEAPSINIGKEIMIKIVPLTKLLCILHNALDSTHET